MLRHSMIRPSCELELTNFPPLLLHLLPANNVERPDGVVSEGEFVYQSDADAAIKLGSAPKRRPILVAFHARSLWNVNKKLARD